MMIFFQSVFFVSGFIIFWAMVGYPYFIRLLSRYYPIKELSKDYNHRPSVTIMVVAHNEERVILNKLNNLLELKYPREKVKFIIASDHSSDKTNQIVKKFISEHSDINMKLYEVKKRMGKTNAQNEALKLVDTEFLVMTDANSIIDSNAVTELMAAFTSKEISYVTGKLTILNKDTTDISTSENSYWDREVLIREIEGRIQSITAGNGALYACRTKEYVDFNPMESHDASMPLYFSLQGKRAICNHDAVAFERAGETIEDEFKRKVRMNRRILRAILPDLRLLNIFKYKWFSFFYLGHRTCRYLLWISHLLLLLSNALIIGKSWVYLTVFIVQIVFYFLALIRYKVRLKNKLITSIYYYCVSIIAQWVGVYNILSGKTKPYWEKAESTR